MSHRFNSNNVRLEDFGDRFLVVCPSCSQCATVIRRSESPPQVVLTCLACGHAKVWRATAPGILYSTHLEHYQPGYVCIGAPVDWYFHLPLWLQMPCCGQTLWAYNPAHLQFLQDYVGATLREQRQDEELGWSNQSLASRLPVWIKRGKNRSEILKSIAQLRQKLT